MITHFYKVPRKDYSKPIFVCTKNVDIIPAKGTYIDCEDNRYRVDNILFDLEKCEYRIIMVQI